MKILIIAPHPDDELSGTGGLILQSPKKDIFVVYATTGAHVLDHEQKAKRKKAVTKILKKLSVNHLFFLTFTQETLYAHLSELYKKIAIIINKVKPDQIYVPAYEGGHIDHDACNLVLSEIKTPAIKYEYAMYNNYATIPHLFELIIREILEHLPLSWSYRVSRPFIPSNQKPFKLKMSKNERQCKQALLDEYTNFMGAKRKNINNVSADYFRRMATHDYLKPPHGILPLGYEMSQKIPFKEFQKFAKHFYKQLNITK